MKGITIAIDGPAASGKSTTARAVAERLGYLHLNSGILYRAITWTALRDGWALDNDSFDARLEALKLVLQSAPPAFRVRVNGAHLGSELQSPEVASRVSAIAARPAVRRKILDVLKRTDRTRVVCDGRDIGTVVYPDAEIKVFLVASPEERGRRRILERNDEPTDEDIRKEAERLSDRDARDAGRDLAPLLRAPDAVELDTTSRTPDQVIEAILRLVDEQIEVTDDS